MIKKSRIFEISFVTFLVGISGAISQYPVGYLSDKLDRRLVIIYSSFGASIFWVIITVFVLSSSSEATNVLV